MKHRLDYGLLVVAVMFFFWVPALVNPRLAGAELEPLAESPPLGLTTEPGATLRHPDGDGIIWRRSLHKIPLASQDLGLKLVGTGVADDPSKSLAVIEIQTTGEQRVYHEGKQFGNVLIKKILWRRVVIDAGMGDEMLSMDGGASAGSLSSGPEMVGLNLDDVDSALPDYMELMRQVRIRPYLEGGQVAGFLIYNIEPGSIFAKMGLEDGDVVRAVNGEAVPLTQQALGFYDALKGGGEVALEITREETPQELHFRIQ